MLLNAGADPTIADAQGFNALHLVTHSSAVMPLLLLLQHNAFGAPSALDVADSQGHTPLMWAAYQGDALSVDLLLAHGANVHAKDATGLTPMHWAVVKGNRLCIRKLAGTGSDLWAKEEGGKTPREMAVELKSEAAYRKALADVGLHEDGRRKNRVAGEVSHRKCVARLAPASRVMARPVQTIPQCRRTILSRLVQQGIVLKNCTHPMPAPAVNSSERRG